MDDKTAKILDQLMNAINNLSNRITTLENNNKDLNIQIHYHTDKYPGLEPLEKHGNFYDVRAAEDIELVEGKQVLIPLGISVNLPDGYYAELLPRSSSFKRYGFLVANSMGIIDSEYRSLEDEWMLSVYPTRDMKIFKNERIAQFTIVKEIPFTLEESTWEAKKRDGFGSSGQ